MINNKNIENFSPNNPFLFDEITGDNIGVSFDEESANTGDIVCITSLYDELIRRFGSYENAKFIYEFARSAIVDGKYTENYPIDSVPYLDFTIYLEQTIIDEGLLSPYVSKWVPGKKYYVGDTVYYSIDGSDENIKTYVLINGDKTETTEIPFSIYEANAGDARYFEENNKYYVKTDYFNGYYDSKTRLVYFDVIKEDGSLSLEHWAEDIEDNVSDGIIYSDIEGMTESLLENVMRKKGDMDISGNTLPFILHYNDIIEDGKKVGRELDSEKTETFFMCGNMNMNYDFTNARVTSDVLESVTFYNSNSIPESGVSFTEVDKPIVITSDKKAYTDENDMYSIADYDMVQFIYYSNASLYQVERGRWGRLENTGVKYIEQRPIIIQTDDFNIEINDEDGTILTLTYIDIVSNTQNNKEDSNIDIINSMRSDINYSNVKVDNEQLSDDYFLKVKTFKDESIMGLQNATEEIDVNIERGIAESFQKHNMLGEICTMQDLENYKNGRYLE